MKQLLIKIIIHLKYHVRPYPNLELQIINFLKLFPTLRTKLQRIGNQKSYYASLVSTSSNREFLIDVTHVYQQDLKTGIQRVVRSILNELENHNSLKDIDIQPVFLTDRSGYWSYRYVKEPTRMVIPKKRDLFLGLDFNSTVVHADYAGLLTDWKSRGVQINFVIYDILPILHPHWWQQGVGLAHEEWLKTVLSYSNKIFCISQTVSDDVKKYIIQQKSSVQNIPSIHWFHLGADIDNSTPSKGVPDDAEFVLNQLTSKPSFLMVGTIEPRKGQNQTLLAFEKLWANGIDINLIIVGKQGWMVDELATKMRSHPEYNRRLFWLEGVSDEYLEKVYTTSICLIASSEGEGFGLPLIEAAQYKLPIIARDIPVFREVAGEFAYYFSNDNDPSVLAVTIMEWLKLYKANNHPESDKMHWLTWQESTKKIVNLLDI